MRQILFAYAALLSLSKVPVVLNILSSLSNANLPIKHFSHEQF